MKKHTPKSALVFINYFKVYFLSIVLLSLLYWLFSPLIIQLVHEWRNDPEFSHGFLIPIVSAYLIWIKRKKIMSIESSPSNNELKAGSSALLIIGLIMFIFGAFVQHIFVEGIAMMTILSGIVFLLYGVELLKVVLFPIGYLIFMLPIPHVVNLFFASQLKFFIAHSSAFLLSLAQIPVLLEGSTLHLPSISLEVVEACSGMQTMISFLAIGAVFAYLGYHSILLRTIIIIMAVPLALLANILRVSMIGAISFYFNNSLAHNFHHYAWTLIVFIGVLGFIAISKGIHRWMEARPIIGTP
jgi:exosortase